ncbi:hypothetical protein RFEPED_1339 [Rickettsia felis str. Pedreira]|uniref:Uncharacterized protein n=1 Tax=Rickettsia felis str. Pedreira TaxID=1359196 RepID=A0A0F3MWJ7_RICFI|nr:hypothetical protein RFEPED_1339 [Rickettsia felis str. Pedreira]
MDTESSLRGKTVSFDEAISGYLTRLPRSLQSRNDGSVSPRGLTTV